MTLLSEKTSALCISVRCEGLTLTCTLLSGPLQVSYSFCGERCLQPDTEPQITSRLPSQHDTSSHSCTIPSSCSFTRGKSAHYCFLPLTCVFEDPFIGLHYRAEAIEHKRAKLGSCALRWLVVIKGSVCQNKPAFLHLQRGHLVATLNLFMKPA